MNWQERAGRGGVCDFKQNYDFYFKWLCNKVMNCFIIKDESEDKSFTETINWNYFRLNLILDGQICITDFNDRLYACIGNRGGEPNEYYVPTIFTIANPILGSKQVDIDVNGVVFYNTDIDMFNYTGNCEIFSGGLYDLISQTATLLADNIISINCNQINSRITAFFTAESEAQAVAGEVVLKKMYAGKPYQILRSDLIEKLSVNPINSSATGNITELVELHNYIIANFFQSIGVKSNNVMKRERLINSEIDSQNDYLKVSLLEILTSWQKGFDKVNEIYGTDISVNLNPALLDELLEDSTSDEMVNGEVSVNDAYESEDSTENTEEQTVQNEPETTGTGEGTSGETEEETENIIEDIEDKAEQIADIIDFINDEEDSQYSNTNDDSEDDISNKNNKESEEKSNVEEEGEDDEQKSKKEDSTSDTD